MYNNWHGKTFDEVVRDFAEFLDYTKEIYFKDKDVEVEMNKKQQDLLHKLEFDDLKYHDIARLGKELKQLRVSRRDYKNECMLSEPIKEFVKENGGDSFIAKLKTLEQAIVNQYKLVDNQYYVNKSTMPDICNLKNDSNDLSSKVTEEVIQLNRVLKQYCRNLTYEIQKDDSYNCPYISMKMQLDCRFNINQGRQLINGFAKNIEKYYRPSGKVVKCEFITSDMLLYDGYNKASLMANMSIYDNNELIYVLNLTIREGSPKQDDKKSNNGNNSKKGKSKKRGGKKKR